MYHVLQVVPAILQVLTARVDVLLELSQLLLHSGQGLVAHMRDAFIDTLLRFRLQFTLFMVGF